MNTFSTNRRDFLKKSGVLALAGIGANFIPINLNGQEPEKDASNAGISSFALPQLPYGYADLEPHIDKMTMEIHHTRHHQGYVNALNQACREQKIRAGLDDIIKHVSRYSETVRNNAGGHWNHSFFWKLMTAEGGGAATGKVAEAINSSFGGFVEFNRAFTNAAVKRFGSGWAWLVVNPSGKLEVGSTPNQDNPMMDVSEFKGTPILGVDVWEHAYYLKYQNLRGSYLSAWWNLINWDQVAENLKVATGK